MNLQDELTQKQALKFEIHGFDPKFLKQTLLRNSEGIFDINLRLNNKFKKVLYEHLNENYKEFDFQQGTNQLNPEIYFKKK